jgi:hypothetical protein
MPLLQPGQTRIGSGGAGDAGSDLYIRNPDGATVIVDGTLGVGALQAVNDAGITTVAITTLPTPADGARGQVDIYATDNEVDDNQIASLRIRGGTLGNLDLCRRDLLLPVPLNGPVPFVQSDGATKDTILGYNFTPYANVKVVGAAGTGLVYDTVNHAPILKAVVGGPGAPQNEAFGPGPFNTTVPDVIGAPFVATKTTNLLIDVQVLVDVDGTTAATVGLSDCVIITVEDMTGGQGIIGRAVIKPFNMPNSSVGGSDYVIHETLFASVVAGETYQVNWQFIAPTGGLVLGGASSGVQYVAYDIQPLA